jgi:hypothetical protein
MSKACVLLYYPHELSQLGDVRGLVEPVWVLDGTLECFIPEKFLNF